MTQYDDHVHMGTQWYMVYIPYAYSHMYKVLSYSVFWCFCVSK